MQHFERSKKNYSTILKTTKTQFKKKISPEKLDTNNENDF